MREGVDCKGKKWVEKKKDSRMIDLSNQTFELLKTCFPVSIEGKSKAGWLCVCNCGKEIVAYGADLRSKKVKSCGKCAADIFFNNKAEEMIGQTFSHLKVIDIFSREKQKGYSYKCVCSCGKEKIFLGRELRSGHVKSCGSCLKKENWEHKRENLEGKRYGYLTVLNFCKTNSKRAFWNCLCDCGKTCVVSGHDLTGDKIHSCGCLKSYGEKIISQILEDNNIHFRAQYSFPDCLSENNKKLFFDFALLNNNNEVIRLIEFDGEQHYKPSSFFGGEEQFISLQKRDNIKNYYAKSHNIPLIRVPYKEKNNITLELLLSNKYLIN